MTVSPFGNVLSSIYSTSYGNSVISTFSFSVSTIIIGFNGVTSNSIPNSSFQDKPLIWGFNKCNSSSVKPFSVAISHNDESSLKSTVFWGCVWRYNTILRVSSRLKIPSKLAYSVSTLTGSNSFAPIYCEPASVKGVISFSISIIFWISSTPV